MYANYKKNTRTKEDTIQNNKFNDNMTFMLLSLIKILIKKKSMVLTNFSYSVNTYKHILTR